MHLTRSENYSTPLKRHIIIMPCEALTMRQFKKESTVLLRNNMGAQPSFQKRLLVDFLIRRYLLEGLSLKILANYWFEWDIKQEHRCFFQENMQLIEFMTKSWIRRSKWLTKAVALPLVWGNKKLWLKKNWNQLNIISNYPFEDLLTRKVLKRSYLLDMVNYHTSLK